MWLGGCWPSFGASTFDGVFRSSHENQSVHSANLPLDITLINGSSPILAETLKLSVNGSDVTSAALIKRTSIGASLHYVFAPRLHRQSHVEYQITFNVAEAESALISWSSSFDTDVRGADDFSVESEDFDYDRGHSRDEANAPGYRGGAYQDRGAELGVDFQVVHPVSDEGTSYRDLGTNSLPIHFSSDRERSGFRLDKNWIVIGASGDWFNYTRYFPSNQYYVYAALSHGSLASGALAGSLVDPGDEFELGYFNAPGNGAWGVDVLVPLRDVRGGDPIALSLEGRTTLRYVCGSGAVDYLLFVPLVRLNVVRRQGNSLLVDWSGDGVLQWSTSLTGTYVPYAAEQYSPATFPILSSEPGRFFKLIAHQPAREPFIGAVPPFFRADDCR